jgi:hypothetical protein
LPVDNQGTFGRLDDLALNGNRSDKMTKLLQIKEGRNETMVLVAVFLKASIRSIVEKLLIYFEKVLID